jgi:transposase InsO family protein
MTTSHDTPSSPGAQPIRDQRTTPRGVLPRQLQMWLMIGLAVLILGIILITGRTAPAPHAALAGKTSAPSALAPDRIEAYQRQLAEDEARLQHELAQQAVPLGAGTATTPPGPHDVPTDPLADEQRRRDYQSLFADNVAFSRRTTDASVSARRAPPMLPGNAQLAAATVSQQDPAHVALPVTTRDVCCGASLPSWRIVPDPDRQDSGHFERVSDISSRLLIDVSVLRLLLLCITGWLDRREREALAYLVDENRLLRRQLGGRRLRFTDDDRRRLAMRAHRLGRAALRDLATVVTPDTLLRWHRQLVARKWTYAKTQSRRRGVLAEIRQVVVRMAEDNPTWGYTRIRGALKNLGHHVGRSTIARILKARGVPPAPQRPTSWQTFLRAHWGAIAAADFFTTEVWTWRGLVTFYTAFVIDLGSRRVQVLGTTAHPDELFMRQVVRTLTMADGKACRVLICDRDTKWSAAVRERLEEAGMRVVQTPYQAPNANAYAERFVRSIKEECLDRIIPIGAGHFRGAVREFVAHYQRERNHQGLENVLIEAAPMTGVGRVHRQSRLGGLLNFYTRAA